MPDSAAPAPVAALALGLWRCHGCAAVCKPPAGQAAQGHGVVCPRCGASILPRKRDAVARSWAFLLAAAALYVPANLLPVTSTSSLLGSQSDTLLSGILYLWHEGSWALALLVFVASIVVPVAKLVLLSYLLISVQRQGTRWAPQRQRVFRFLELIGRWSMLDIFVVAMLAALVQIHNLAELRPGPGAIAFAAVVVLTMLATRSFDARLIWDRAAPR